VRLLVKLDLGADRAVALRAADRLAERALHRLVPAWKRTMREQKRREADAVLFSPAARAPLLRREAAARKMTVEDLAATVVAKDEGPEAARDIEINAALQIAQEEIRAASSPGAISGAVRQLTQALGATGQE